MKSLIVEEDWSIISSFLPPRWQWQVKKLGAVKRKRGIPTYEGMFRLLMLHISGGLSLEQACMRARELGIADITGMALHKRLKTVKPLFDWLCEKLVQQSGIGGFSEGALANRRVLAVDSSDISEPGATGATWRMHYALLLPQLRSAHAEFTAHTEAESLERFAIREGDVLMADRNYAKRRQLAWLIERKADAIMRMSPTLFPLNASEEEGGSDLPFEWLEHLRTLKGHKPKEWTARFEYEGKSYQVRVCAVRKSKAAERKAVKEILKEARRQKRQVRPETLEYAKYVIVVTTLDVAVLDTRAVLEMYRSRWQVELAFKRLKSLLDCRCVPKTDEASALAWMQGKLLEALLLEKLLDEAECFSPWGHQI